MPSVSSSRAHNRWPPRTSSRPPSAACSPSRRRPPSTCRRSGIAILATGSELRAPGDPLEPGQIYESNSVLLDARLGAWADLTILQPVPDDPDTVGGALARGLERDVLITSGGVSMGEHD